MSTTTPPSNTRAGGTVAPGNPDVSGVDLELVDVLKRSRRRSRPSTA